LPKINKLNKNNDTIGLQIQKYIACDFLDFKPFLASDQSHDGLNRDILLELSDIMASSQGVQIFCK
jgi:hypothetical protein